jgi:two-component system phosphate regulon sensor histidine kinase PhoR
MTDAALIAIGVGSTALGVMLLLGSAKVGFGVFALGIGLALGLWGLVRLMRREASLAARLALLAQNLRVDGPVPQAAPHAEGAATDAEQAGSAAVALIEALRAGERDLRAMFDAVDAAVIATDAGGLVILCNAAAGEFVGRPAPTLIGRPIDELFTQVDLLELHASTRSGHAHSRHIRLPRPEGMRVFEVFVAPLARAAAAPGSIMTLRDVTELARSVQVRTDFVVNASHELRTPIAALRLAADALEDGGSDDPAMQKRILGMISGHVARLEELTKDLLDLSRLESPELSIASEPVAASALADELTVLFAGACRQRGLTLAFDLEPALEAMQSDRRLLLLILKNLIENSTKFADEGSTIRIVGRAIPNGAWGSARFEVIDKGLGIPLNQQDRIFERFYQIDEARSGQAGARRGTGLGLAIVKHAVRTLGGQVRVQSVWKQGTTMIVDLPGCLPPANAGGAAPAAQRTFR